MCTARDKAKAKRQDRAAGDAMQSALGTGSQVLQHAPSKRDPDEFPPE